MQAPKQEKNLWQELKEPHETHFYYPNRFEYFFGLALQGLVIGRAEKQLNTVICKACMLAEEAEKAIDSREDGIDFKEGD